MNCLSERGLACYIFFLLITVLGSIPCNSQTIEQISAIENSYNEFKDELAVVVGGTYSSDISEKKYYAKFPRSLISIKQINSSVGISDPFTPPLEATQQAIKRAALIQALKSNCKAFTVIDYYTKFSPAIRKDKAMGLKEMVNVFVDSLYDTRNAIIIDHEYLQTGELILTVDFSKCHKTASVGLFEIFKSTKEKGQGIQKTSNIKIMDNRDKSDYELKKDYEEQTIVSRDISSNKNYENFYFSYSSYNTKFGVKGGLWAYLTLRLSDVILDQATEKTSHVKSVTDYHVNNLIVDLKRTSGFFKFRFKYKSFITSLRKF